MWYVDVVKIEDDSVVKTLGPFGSERLAHRVESGVDVNLDHDGYYTVIRHD